MSVPAQERVFGRFGPANTLPHFGAMTTRAANFNFGRHTPTSANDMSDTATQHHSFLGHGNGLLGCLLNLPL